MACFLAPTAAVIVVSSVRKRVPARYHIDWLITMLWGGVAMLIVEHIAHQEVVFYPPFLTAMKDPADIPVMLQEITTIGVGMTIAIFFVWALMVLVVNNMPKILKMRKDKIKNLTT